MRIRTTNLLRLRMLASLPTSSRPDNTGREILVSERISPMKKLMLKLFISLALDIVLKVML